MTKTVNVGIIGIGAMGYNHIRVLLGLEGVKLVAIADLNEGTLEKVSSEFRIPNTYISYNEMLKKHKFDVIIIATPTKFHKKIAIDCLKSGINVFVEKPIADSVPDAKEMIKLADKHKKLLIVGHIERFNPVVVKFKEFIDQKMLGNIYLVNTIRAGPYPKRIKDVGVLVDLAVHDIDIIRYLVGEIKQIYSQLINSGKVPIYCKSMFKIYPDINGSSEFSWVSPKRTRIIQIYGTNGILEGNYQDQTLKFYENSESDQQQHTMDYYKDMFMLGNISSGKIIEYPIKKEEPLKIELEHLMDCVRGNKKLPMDDPHEALKALHIALLMLESGEKEQPVLVKQLVDS